MVWNLFKLILFRSSSFFLHNLSQILSKYWLPKVQPQLPSYFIDIFTKTWLYLISTRKHMQKLKMQKRTIVVLQLYDTMAQTQSIMRFQKHYEFFYFARYHSCWYHHFLFHQRGLYFVLLIICIMWSRNNVITAKIKQ